MNSENNNEDIVQKRFSEAIQTLERYLDFKYWGFKVIHFEAFPQSSPYAIYQSEKCLIRFRWVQSRPHAEPMIYTTYGRLHAPFDQDVMVWNGQKCYCWHVTNGILNFLDGMSPTTITINDYVAPRILRDFYQFNKDYKGSLGEYIAKVQTTIWNHYGNHFFDLFDLRRPDLWEKYSKFLKEYYEHQYKQAKLEVHKPFISEPPLYLVC